MNIQRTINSSYWITALLLIGVLWIWFSRAPSGGLSQSGVSTPRKGFQAPDFSLADANGSMIRLSDLRGQPVVINLWASWCQPCRAEMPALQRVYAEYQSQGLVLLGVNATNQDDAAAARAFTEELGLTFPILYDSQGAVAKLYALRALPTTFFIDRAGVIREVVIGGPMSEALLRIRVQQLIERPFEGMP
jgi:peroxiredoxin